MKTIFKLVVLLSFVFILPSCDTTPTFTDVLSSKNFKVRKMTNNQSQNIHGGFFLFSGNIDGETTPNVSFAWELRPDMYINSTFNLESVVVVLDTTKIQPVVEFHLNSKRYFNDDPRHINYHIKWVTIKCHPDQWIIDINLPYQEKSK